MANISAQMVKELRERTGAGMMECKQALVDAEGDADRAAALLRERGASKAEKRMGRSAKEGRLEGYGTGDGRGTALVELNCETDFVARTDEFIALARALARQVYEAKLTAEALLAASAPNDPGHTVADTLKALSAKTGENVQLGACARFEGAAVSSYIHHDGKGGGLVELAGAGATEGLARELAKHVYATAPRWGTRDQVPAELVSAERETFRKQAESEGKAGKALEGYVEGQVRSFLEENCLTEQVFVLDLAKPKKERRTVAQLLGNQASVVRFQRLRVGEA